MLTADDSDQEPDEEDEKEEGSDDGEEAAKPKEALPMNFGKRLAHTDKVVRDRGFRFFKAWLQRNHDLQRPDYLKLWKGLFFGMWMADKRPVQQDLSVKIALLINDIPHRNQSVWIDTFWETMIQTWEKIDIHRMSKFMQFARIVVAESFKVLRVYGWKESEVRAFGQTFTQGATVSKGSNSVVSVGLIYHFAHFFWDELSYQLAAEPQATPEQIMVLLQPFYDVVETCPIRALVNKINEGILRKTPEEFVPPLIEKIRVSVANRSLEDFHREVLAKTAAEFGVTDLVVLEKVRETKKERLKRQQRERTDFVARQRKKRKNVTEKAKFCEEFLAKGKQLDEKPQEASVDQVRRVATERSASPAVSQSIMSPLMLPKAAMGDDAASEATGKRKKRKSKSSGADGGGPSAGKRKTNKTKKKTS